jgi:hypothetical protein
MDPEILFGKYLQCVMLHNLKFTLMVSSPLLEITINFALIITTNHDDFFFIYHA